MSCEHKLHCFAWGPMEDLQHTITSTSANTQALKSFSRDKQYYIRINLPEMVEEKRFINNIKKGLIGTVEEDDVGWRTLNTD